MLTQDELIRYDRQIMMPEFGREGQEKLKKAKIFIAGAGGLGSPISIYLAVAGVGALRIADHDNIELSNLNRQILHWNEDVGKDKVDSAKQKLSEINRSIDIETINRSITDDNVLELTEGCDAIVDAMDNFYTRYTLNRAAIKRRVPLFHGAVNGLEGRAMTIIPGETACIRCMYHGPIETVKFPVLGVTPGLIGIIQVTEVIKYIVGMGELLKNRLLIYDGMDLTFKEFKIKRNPECEDCGHL
jgi:molybdopterin/thiamine biosynthesis adenylyltransferase